MKIVTNQFKFVVKSRRLKQKIWDKYVSLKKSQKTTKLNDNDKFFLRQVRESIKVPEREITVIHVPSNISVSVISKDQKLNRKDLVTKLLKKIQQTRIDLRKVKKETKQFDGANYDIVGGVMVGGGLINEIAKRTKTNDPYATKLPRLKNKNYIGIELEFNQINGMGQDAIADALKAAGLARYVDVTSDGSCGWEVRVLVPEDNYVDPLTKITQIIRDLGHTVDHRCGTHIHLDMRNRDVKMVYENMFKTQKFLRKFLTRSRKHNRFCLMNKAETFDKQLSIGDRYYSLNVQAYSRHKTLEVRMHQGTLSELELIPWIKLLIKIANYKTAVESKVNTLKQAKKQFEMEEDLSESLEKRILTLFKGDAPTNEVEEIFDLEHIPTSNPFASVIRQYVNN